MRNMPPRNLRNEPVAVEEVMGSGMTDPRLHDHGSLKDGRASIQDPPIHDPEDEISDMLNRHLPPPFQKVVMSGFIREARMNEDGAHITVENKQRTMCVFVKGMVIAELDIFVDVVAHIDPRNPSDIQRVSLVRSGGAPDEDRS